MKYTVSVHFPRKCLENSSSSYAEKLAAVIADEAQGVKTWGEHF